MKVLGYLRCSTDDQADSGLGLEACRESVHQQYERKYRAAGYEFGGIYEDPAVSGGSILRSRKGGFRLVTAADSGDIIIFPKLDRGFRDTEDMLTTVRVLRERGVVCVFLDLPFDTTTPEGELMLTVMGGFSRFERRRIGERTREALNAKKRKAADKGQLNPLGRPRYGLRRVRGHLTINQEEYDDGLAILDWQGRGFPFDQIAWHLNAVRDKTATGRIWTKSSVRRAWKSMRYIQAWLTETDRDGKPVVRTAKK